MIYEGLYPVAGRERMAALWSDEATYRPWLNVEVLAVEAWSEIGATLTLTRSATLLVDAATELERVISSRARELRDMSMVGRTHGIHAQPITMGAKLALSALQVRRDRERLEAELDEKIYL